MGKCIKKILVFASTVALFVSSNVLISYAQTPIGYIAVDTFEKTMDEMYSQYDSSFKVLDNNGVEYISIEHANEMYQRAVKVFEEKQIANQAKADNSFNEVDNRDNLSVSSKGVMPVDYYKQKKFKVECAAGLASANFAHDCRGTVNAQYGSFMNLTYSGVYRNGTALNYDSFSISNLKKNYALNSTIYRVQFTIAVTFSWTDPTTGLKLNEVVRENRVDEFNAS